MYGQLPKNRFFHGFSEADLGHASLFFKLPCSCSLVVFSYVSLVLFSVGFPWFQAPGDLLVRPYGSVGTVTNSRGEF